MPRKTVQYPLELSSAESERFWSKIDKTDGCWLWLAATNQFGYGLWRWRHGTSMLTAHKVVWVLHNQQQIRGQYVLDHICHVEACVNPDHLREVSNAENLENRKGATVKSKSGIRGAIWHGQTGKWSAQVRYRGHAEHLGLYSTPEEAGAVAKRRREELGFLD